MNNLLSLFISESRDLLQQIGESLLTLEKQPGDTAAFNTLFRSVHTLKGNSGLLEFPEMTRILHKSEDLLVAVRDGKRSFTHNIADVLLDAMDFVGSLIDEIAANEKLINSHEKSLLEHIKNIQSFLPDNEAAGGSAVHASTQEEHSPSLSSIIVNIPENERQKLFLTAVQEGQQLSLIIYSPEEDCFFKNVDPFYQILHIPHNLGGTIIPRQPFPPFSDYDCYQCILDFYCITSASKEELSVYLQSIKHQVRIESISPYAFIVPQGEIENSPVHEDFCRNGFSFLAKNDMDSLRTSIGNRMNETSPSLWIHSALRWLLLLVDTVPQNKEVIKRMLEAMHLFEQPQFPFAEVKQESRPVKTDSGEINSLSSHVRKLLGTQVEILNNTLKSPWEEGRTRACITTIRRCLEFIKYQDLKGFDAAAEETLAAHTNAALLSWLEKRTKLFTKAPVDENRVSLQNIDTTLQVLRVDHNKIERLMDLVGEVVVAKNSLPYLAQKAALLCESRELSNEIKTLYNSINRIAGKLQGAVMQIRMVPLKVAFQRFPRLVRDLSRDLNKKIELKMEGEEIEVDKSVIEALGEPLIHLVRNSIDHGIELPEHRAKQKKPQTGSINLRGFHEGNNVVIEIVDDGTGIDPEVIKQKAFKQNIITREEMESLNEEESINLIFHSGFTTNETTSELSGRGVGMDAVKHQVEKIGGQVKISSSVGKGTCVRLLIPISMVITNVMIVETHNQLFGIPLDSMVETVRVKAERFKQIKNHTTMVIRNQVISLFYLNDLLNIKTPNIPNDDGEYAVCLVRMASGIVGIVTDGFRNVVDIPVRPLEGKLALIPGYSGTAILGDGSVLLVLNVQELF